jgi:phosphoribosylformylglycinamidine synthase
VGVIEDASRVLARTFRQAGDDIVLLGEGFGELGGSEYLKVVHGEVKGEPPMLDLAREAALIGLLTKATASGLLQSAHDCSDGGVAVTLAECSFGSGGIGLEADVPDVARSFRDATLATDAALFGESASRAVVSVVARNRDAFLQMAAATGVPARIIGKAGGHRLRIRVAGNEAIDCTITEAEQLWATAIDRYFTGRAA